MIGLILLIFLTIVSCIFGLFCLIVSLGYPDWFKQFWQKNINAKLPQDLINKTTIVGAICTSLSVILLLVILTLDSGSDSDHNTHHRHSKKKKADKDIVFLQRKLKKGPSGGSYYTKKKCTGFGKSKKCKMIKIYAK